MFRTFLVTALCGVLVTVSPTPGAQTWPDRPIKWIVPYGPGAMGDTVARVLAEELRSSLGQPVVVENRAGAGGNLGGSAVARASPDGSTFLIAATNNLVVNQFLYKKLDHDPSSAFAPVTFLVNVPSVLFVHPSVGRNFKDFSAAVVARKGKLNYGSPGAGTTPHLSMHALDQLLGAGMTHVAYPGAAQGVLALIAGDVHAYMGGAGLALQHVQAGRVNAIGVSNDKRLTALPETPTFAEIGLGALRASNWWGLVAPSNTPPQVIQKMNEAVQVALRRPGVVERFDKLGIQANPVAASAMGRQMQEEALFWKKAVAEAGVSLD
ncbi:MAG: Bug family tripartite tricarboxylate transporter substrate binding protein [Burkholderiales bacterium]